MDRILHWWGQSREKEYVPPAWFESPEPLLCEPKLLLLGAMDTREPRVFQLEPADQRLLAAATSPRAADTGFARGDSGLLLTTIAAYNKTFASDQSTAMGTTDFAVYEEKIRRL